MSASFSRWRCPTAVRIFLFPEIYAIFAFFAATPVAPDRNIQQVTVALSKRIVMGCFSALTSRCTMNLWTKTTAGTRQFPNPGRRASAANLIRNPSATYNTPGETDKNISRYPMTAGRMPVPQGFMGTSMQRQGNVAPVASRSMVVASAL